eukprot:5891285-Prymnesium_polylepis.1
MSLKRRSAKPSALIEGLGVSARCQRPGVPKLKSVGSAARSRAKPAQFRLHVCGSGCCVPLSGRGMRCCRDSVE